LEFIHFVDFNARALLSNQTVWNFSVHGISLHNIAIF
jgi:hypothetical protein